MALKSSHPEGDKVDIEELLEVVDKTLDRLKVLYEQYFLGTQKQPPAQIHTDVERRLRELQQINIRNTSLRYRFATLTQKFGSYNSYWRRTLRQIETGTYIRQLAKVGRQAALTGAEVPPEILAAMTPRMREQVKRDREQALSVIRRREGDRGGDFDVDDAAAVIGESAEVRQALPRGGTHKLAADDDFDIDAFFASVTDEEVEPAATQPVQDSTQVVPVVPMPQQRPSQAIAQQRPSQPMIAQQPTRPSQPAMQERPSQPVVTQPAGANLFGTAGLTQDRPSAPAIPSVIPSVPRPGTPPPVPGRPGTPPPIPRAATNPGRAPSQSEPDSTQVVPVVPVPRPGTPLPPRATAAQPALPTQDGTQVVPVVPVPRPSEKQPVLHADRPTGPQPPLRPTAAQSPLRPTGAQPAIPKQPDATQVVPVVPIPGAQRPTGGVAPSQVSRPNPIQPGSSTGRTVMPVQTVGGRAPEKPKPDPAPAKPPPGMNEADVNALYAKYVSAKKAVGEDAGPGAYGKLLKTINAQAPKIMEQYKAKGVEFSIVVKDNQVIIKAKPKT
ncbi:MAG TPA: MXAN_5187 C-terminal domain-containing protein [Kofleriaceae bacterium]